MVHLKNEDAAPDSDFVSGDLTHIVPGNVGRNFEDERKFAAWAGVAAGNNESAGKTKIQLSKG